MTYPKCEHPDGCNGAHDFHGLPCTRTKASTDRYPAGPCGCVGAFDDDYWKDGAQ